ncbi:beta/gamma crystallin domain-containing protein [Streptomyces sp. AC558_RSS880]|uniref:beta/gamma crystallin domain-containing protein n=1 Tax=Streptomyces sp. AC558_RSS880 TaxID=2823687 RepID=UPI001C224C72|nr:beta/gamma crystallin domain-containing protein [Streptomyces sp. AC558_RSS880]
MKRSLKRVLVAAGSTAALAVSLPVSTAAAINTAPCGDRNDLVKIEYYNGGSSVCYANAGSMNVNIPEVYRVSTGNNNVIFRTNVGTEIVGKWKTKRVVEPGTTMTSLHIL